MRGAARRTYAGPRQGPFETTCRAPNVSAMKPQTRSALTERKEKHIPATANIAETPAISTAMAAMRSVPTAVIRPNAQPAKTAHTARIRAIPTATADTKSVPTAMIRSNVRLARARANSIATAGMKNARTAKSTMQIAVRTTLNSRPKSVLWRQKHDSGDPKRRREEERRHETPPARKAEPEETLAALEVDPEQIICGRNPIREALRAGRPIEKLLAASELSGSAREIVKMAKDAGAVVQIVDRARLDQIYPAHQGLLAYVAAVKYSSVEEMLALAKEKGEDPFLILLDGITDPHNLGAIIRSAECAGAHGVIIPERRASGLTATVAKAAAGALESMKIARVVNLNRTIDELKEKGVWIIGTSMDGENAFHADLTGPVGLVIGSEGEGISRLTMEKCDRMLTLPMKGKIESLNASVAAGVLMYAVLGARAKQ